MNRNMCENFSDRNNFGVNKIVSNDNKNKQAVNTKKNNKRKKFYQQGRYYHQSHNIGNPDNNIDDNPCFPVRKKKKQNDSEKVDKKIKKKQKNSLKSKRKAQSQNKSNLPRFKGTERLPVNNHVRFDHRLPKEDVPLSSDVNNVEQNFQHSSKASLPSAIVNEYNKANNHLEVIDNINADKLFAFDETKLFRWLLHPVAPAAFKRDYWENSPLFIDRSRPCHYSPLNVTTESIDSLLRENHVLFGKNIDITTYTDGVRETHNPVGRAQAHIVWDFFKNGCSVRLLNPQTYINSVYRLNEKLQRYFNGFVGANLYLTPPNSQGFAPHYDDIEAFVMQLQGCKYWKVYPPRMKSEQLPRYSSRNFTEEEVGKPILEVALRPGDLLYFPRGFIHQASTRDDLSLHITLSAHQCTAYIDLFEKLLPDALSKAARDDVDFRRGLPLEYPKHLGCALERGASSKLRNIYKTTVIKMAKKLIDYIDIQLIDSAVDNLVAKSLHDQLPPYFPEGQKKSMMFSNSTTISNDCKTVNLVQLQLSSRIRLASTKICRLVKTDDGKYLLYHSINNSMEYHGCDEEFLEVPNESVSAFRLLYRRYPNYIKIKSLPIEGDEAKWSFANSLWEVGLLMTQKPLKPIITDFSGNNEEEVDEDEDDDSGEDSVDNEDNCVVDEDNDKDLSCVIIDSVKDYGQNSEKSIPVVNRPNSVHVVDDKILSNENIVIIE